MLRAKRLPSILGGAATAPTLSGATVTPGGTTATLGVTTNQAGGTLYWIVSSSATPPSIAQIEAGQDSTGAAATASGNQAVSASGAQSANATGLTLNTTYYAYFMQLSGGLTSNILSSTSFTTTGISAPTYAIHTALGTTPASWDVTGDSTFQTGMWVHQQFAADAAFTTSLVDYYTEVQGQFWEATSENIGGPESAGISGAAQTFVQPSGTYYSRCRFETLPGDPTNNVVSGWSNTVTDTITAAVTVWPSSSGTDESQYLTPSGSPVLTLTGNSNTNAPNGARGSHTPPASSKRYWEAQFLGAGNQSGGNVLIGITDSTTALGPAVFPTPGGSGGGGGACFRLKNATTGNNVYGNGTFAAGTALSTALAINDYLGILSDDVANTVSLYHKPGAGAWYLVQTFTMTSQIPANRRPYVAGYGTGDKTTSNFGQSAFSQSPIPGSGIMWG